MDADPIPAQLRAFFAGCHPELAAAWLFGSVARGTAREGSDVDVAVLVGGRMPTDAEALDLKLDLEAELDRTLHREVDVVVVNTAPADLVHRVLRDGILVLERDRSARIAFEVRSRAEYFDLVPILQEYRRYRGDEP